MKEVRRMTGNQLMLVLILIVGSTGTALAQPGVPKMTSPLYGGGARDIGQTSNGLPPALKEAKIEQKLGEQIPLDLTFQDETGRSVQLAQYFKQRPVILTLVYYDCPMLCNQVLNALTGTLKAVPFTVGRDFDIVTVSFDPREKPELAAQKKQIYLEDYKQAGAEAGWHFLTGDEASIKKLTDAVGFHYKYDEATQQFAHASAIMIATPEGRLSHYFYGIEYAPKEVRLSLVEASQNKIGSPVDQLLLYCYHYDPATGKYGLMIMKVVRLAGILTIIGIALLMLLLRRRLIDPTRGFAGGGAA